MSESGSRAAETVSSKDKAKKLTERQRSNQRLFELNRARQPILVPSDKSTYPPLTRCDAPQSGLRQSPISAQSVSLIDRRVHIASATRTSSPEESAANLAYEKKLIGQRKRNAKRASRSKYTTSALEAPPRTPVITVATSNEEGSSADREREQTESELEERTRDRYDEMSGLVPGEHDPSKDFEWFEKVGDDAEYFGSGFDRFASETGL